MISTDFETSRLLRPARRVWPERSSLLSARRALDTRLPNAGLGQWQVDGGRIAAELSARNTRNDIVEKWQRYRFAVTRFYRLSAALPGNDRRLFVRDVRSYFDRMKTIPWAAPAIPTKADWTALRQTRKFRQSMRYRKAYDVLSNSFLSLGDAFVNQVLKLHPEV